MNQAKNLILDFDDISEMRISLSCCENRCPSISEHKFLCL